MAKKLFLVKCRGMTYSMAGRHTPGIAYVVADNADEAYKRVRSSLDTLDLGFSADRELHTVELLAEEGQYPGPGVTLYA